MRSPPQPPAPSPRSPCLRIRWFRRMEPSPYLLRHHAHDGHPLHLGASYDACQACAIKQVGHFLYPCRVLMLTVRSYIAAILARPANVQDITNAADHSLRDQVVSRRVILLMVAPAHAVVHAGNCSDEKGAERPKVRPSMRLFPTAFRPTPCHLTCSRAMRALPCPGHWWARKSGPPLQTGLLLATVLAARPRTRRTLGPGGEGPPQPPAAVQRRATELWRCATRVLHPCRGARLARARVSSCV